MLPWPNDNSTHKTPRDHLDSLGVTPNRIYKVVPMKSTARVRLQVRQLERGKESQDGLLMPSTIDRITEYLGNATAALDDVNGSAMAATQLLALLGWAPPPGVDDIGLAQLDVSVLGARLDELTELRSQENASDADLALAVAAVVTAVVNAYDDIEQIVDSFQATPEYLAATGIRDQFFDRVDRPADHPRDRIDRACRDSGRRAARRVRVQAAARRSGDLPGRPRAPGGALGSALDALHRSHPVDA